MRLLIKIFVPPMIMPLVGFILSVCLAYERVHSPRIINGQTDDAPWYAAQVLFVGSVLSYFALLIINCICLKIGQSAPRRLFGSYFVAIVVCALLIGSHNLIHRERIFLTLGFGLIFSATFILPMALISWGMKCWEEKRPLK
jgi:hypothetical protein